MMIVEATREELRAISRLHCLGLPNDLLAQLGEGFLNHLYSVLLEKSLGFVLVAKTDDNNLQTVAGFVSCAFNTGSFYKRAVHENFLPFCWFAMLFLVKHPLEIRKIVGALLYPNKSTGVAMPELISIVVDPKQKGRGIGKKLLAEFELKLKSNRQPSYFLIVGENNHSAREFYLSCGFRQEAQLDSMQRSFLRLIKEVA